MKNVAFRKFAAYKLLSHEIALKKLFIPHIYLKLFYLLNNI
jgi:hypothetical protein